jgi:hypothetical protein
MTCTITRLLSTVRRDQMVYRVLVSVDGQEVMHQSADSKGEAVDLLIAFLALKQVTRA